jgi:arylsulfatase A-like enzyme
LKSGQTIRIRDLIPMTLVLGTVVFAVDMPLYLSEGFRTWGSFILALRDCGTTALLILPLIIFTELVIRSINFFRADTISLNNRLSLHLSFAVTGFLTPVILYYRIADHYQMFECLLPIIFVLLFLLSRRYLPWSKLLEISRKPGPSIITVVTLVIMTFGFAFNTGSLDFLVRSDSSSGSDPERKNVILIIMDTVRKDRLSLYGYERQTTPYLDQFARESIVFENAFSSSSWTIPAHASLFTGLYPSQLHLAKKEKAHWLNNSFRTLAEILGEKGMKTYGYSANGNISAGTNFAQGFDLFWQMDPEKGLLKGSSFIGYYGFVDWLYSTAGHFMAKLKGGQNLWYYSKTQSKDKTTKGLFDLFDYRKEFTTPFFLFINYMPVHDPFCPPPDYALKFLSEEQFRESIERTLYRPSEENVASRYSDDDRFIFNALYDAEVNYLDSQLRRLIEGIKKRGLYDDSLIIITSDHGEHLGQHNLIYHGKALYDETIRVPLIIFDGKGKGASRDDRMVNLIDIFETILSAFGIEERPIEMSRAINLLVDRDEGRRKIYTELVNAVDFGSDTDFYGSRSLRTQTIHLIDSYSPHGLEFYNMTSDPNQLADLYSERFTEANSYNDTLQQWLTGLTVPVDDWNNNLTEDELNNQIEVLKGLGYIK